MKFFISFIGMLFFAPIVFSQTEIKNQPSADWYINTWKLHQSKRIKGDSLLKIKPDVIPVGFQDTLRKYDWIDIGSYLFVDKKLSVSYNEQPSQYKISRLAEGDTLESFSYNCGVNYTQGSVTHTNWKVNYNMLPTYTFKKIGASYYIELCYGKTSKEYLKLISYKNGVLVYDTPFNGKITDKKIFSRNVLMANKNRINWNKSENN